MINLPKFTELKPPVNDNNIESKTIHIASKDENALNAVKAILEKLGVKPK